jgi:glutamate synthase (ferredoxin)
MAHPIRPGKQGLYDPLYEHDACGVGFLVDLKNRKSHAIVQNAIQILLNLKHRGACGCEKNTGDGAGILLQVPHRFLARECDRSGIALPNAGAYGTGLVFLPSDAGQRQRCERIFEGIVGQEGQTVLGWRNVPVDDSMIGATAKAVEPVMRQIFIGKAPEVRAVHDGDSDLFAFERRLYVIRKRVEQAVKASDLVQKGTFYIPSLSCKTLVYKGMLNSDQLAPFFPDLSDPAVETALAMVHSRFSTNTFPNWARAHPYRYLCHNGESTRCAATSTGCARVRACFSQSCSARTSRKSCPSSTRTAAIRPCSTTPWSCSSWPAARFRTR